MGVMRHGAVWNGMAGTAKQGGVRPGKAWRGKDRRGLVRQAGQKWYGLPPRGGPTPIVANREKICRIGNIGAA